MDRVVGWTLVASALCLVAACSDAEMGGPGEGSPADAAAGPAHDSGPTAPPAAPTADAAGSPPAPGADPDAAPAAPPGDDAAPPAPPVPPDPEGDAGAPPTPPPPPGAPGAERRVGYFAAWAVYGRDFHVNEIPAERLTHVNYAFANIADGRCVLGDAYADIDKFYEGDSWDAGSLRGSFHQLQLLKSRHPHLRTLLSVGGWTWSTGFSDVALSAESRSRFAQSCVDLAIGYGFDGVDIDWEYPVSGGDAGTRSRPEDRENYTLLLAELRRALDARAAADGRAEGYLLTIAAPAGPSLIRNLEVEALWANVDWINVMTYDFHGGWDAVTGFNAPLFGATGDPTPGFDVASALQAYLDRGVPPGKLVMGVPFYGRGWAGVGAAADGVFQPHGSAAPPGTWEAGVFDWHDLVANYLPRMTRHWHPESQVPWLYDAASGLMISYDDPESLARKVAYVRERGLGGVMIWELSSDDASHTLMEALR